ncbi:SUKH-4 family immunity protein [Streptomyces sp. NPDC052040]|uniref:SUKH-4 family immunity protein n=1 Tax=Streptomyces sp. NPDC052040 TaxID=3365682 RepID=UPI0037D796A5
MSTTEVIRTSTDADMSVDAVWVDDVIPAAEPHDRFVRGALRTLDHDLECLLRGGTGLRLDLPARLLDEEFGSAAVVRFEDIDFPGTLTHEPTRRFLRDTGLPEHGHWYELDTDVPLPTLTEYHADRAAFADFTGRAAFGEAPSAPAGALPEGADRLIRLGGLRADTSLVVDGTTGQLLSWSESDGALRPLDADVSTLAFAVWLVHRAGEVPGCQD